MNSKAWLWHIPSSKRIWTLITQHNKFFTTFLINFNFQFSPWKYPKSTYFCICICKGEKSSNFLCYFEFFKFSPHFRFSFFILHLFFISAFLFPFLSDFHFHFHFTVLLFSGKERNIFSTRHYHYNLINYSMKMKCYSCKHDTCAQRKLDSCIAHGGGKWCLEDWNIRGPIPWYGFLSDDLQPTSRQRLPPPWIIL